MALGVVGAAVVAPGFSVMGLSLNVVVACAGGAFSSFGWGEKVRPRDTMFKLLFSCIFMGMALTGLTNALMDEFTDLTMTDGLQASIGAIVSCLTRFWLPSVSEKLRSGAWVNWIPFINKGDKSDDNANP